MNHPTIGRTVRFTNHNGAQLPAIIVRVWNERCVNLAVFDDTAPNMGCRIETSVLVANSPGTPTTGIRTWHWPAIE